jgi:DNA-binding GntR family transcriptional regulator
MPLLSGKAAVQIPRHSLADSVHERLLEAILSGKIASGSELNEVALAQELGVSRTPVHEAIRRLAADGLVRYTVSRKAQVASLSSKEVVEIYQVRTVLETAAARLAALHIEPQELKKLRAASDSLAGPQSDRWPQRAINFDLDFHEVIAAASRNERLRMEVGRYRMLVRAFCRITGDVKNLRDAFDEHLRILEALENHDPTAAGSAMASHIESRLRTVLEEVYSDSAEDQQSQASA